MTAGPLVTFDCYGTLIDFDLDGATTRIVGPRLSEAGVDLGRFLHDFAVMRYQAAVDDYRTYKSLIPRCLEHAMQLFNVPYRPADGDALVAAITEFPPFPDVPPALRKVKEHHRIAIISNTDDDLLAHNVARIGVEFDYLITAEQARAYKPQQAIFEYAFRTFGTGPETMTHVAQGFPYDIVPTARWPMRRIWVNRFGLSGDDRFMPYEEIPDLSALPQLLAHEN